METEAGDDLPASLPSQLPLSDDEAVEDPQPRPPAPDSGFFDWAELPDLPMSDEETVEHGPKTTDTPEAEDAQDRGQQQDPAGVANGSFAPCSTGASPQRVSVLSRRGRRDSLHQAVLREMVEAAGPPPFQPTSGGMQVGREPAELGTCATGASSSLTAARRKELVRATTLTQTQRQNLRPSPLGGLCPLAPFCPALEVARMLAEGAPEERDEEVLALAKRLQSPTPHGISVQVGAR